MREYEKNRDKKKWQRESRKRRATQLQDNSSLTTTSNTRAQAQNNNNRDHDLINAFSQGHRCCLRGSNESSHYSTQPEKQNRTVN